MGNSASNPSRTSASQRTDHSSPSQRDSSISPGPGHPHRSLRTKKKSLELPDFVSLTLTPSTISARGRQKTHTPATAIPIPAPPNSRNPFSHYSEVRGIQPQRQRPRNNFSSTISVTHLHDEFDHVPSSLETPSIPFPPPSRAQQREQQQQQREQHQRQQQQQRSASKQRGRQPPMSPRQAAKMQELYDNSLDPHHPAAPPSSPASAPRPGYVREVVRSSIPVALGAAPIHVESQENNLLSPIQEDLSADPVPVTIVWKGGGTEVILARAGDDDWKGRQPMEREPDSNIWTATVHLRPGAHHVRFLVDGQWRVADDLPAAVDDQGSLANYVAVYGLTPPPQLAAPPPPPPPARKMVPGQSFWSATSTDGDNDTDDASPPQPTTKVISKHPKNAAAMAYVQARWTNVLPLELIEAQKEEEMYLAASAGQFEAQQQQQAASGRVVVTGFIPAPNIPAAPGLPRHLDKLILNSRVGEKPVGQDRAATPGSQGSGVGSGQGGGRRRDREHRERERDREREREKERERERERDRDIRDRDRDRDKDRAGRSRRPNIPPPPPPSEDGSAELDIESTYIPMNQTNGSAAGVPTSPRNPTHSSSSSATKMSIIGNSAIASTAATTPHISVPGTPTMSATQSARKLLEGQPGAGSSTQPQPPTLERAAFSGSRMITIDTSTMPALTDDASVLPLPSHVVLHHLCTSAIKNGVLAVANTTRYRKKYLTTIYYKPT